MPIESLIILLPLSAVIEARGLLRKDSASYDTYVKVNKHSPYKLLRPLFIEILSCISEKQLIAFDDGLRVANTLVF